MRTRRRFLVDSALFLTLAALPASAKAVQPAPRTLRSVSLRVPVLMYHRIAPKNEIGNSLPGLVISPTQFRSQLTALKRSGWTTVTAATLAEHLGTGEPLPKKTMVITIDDGRVDGYTNAFPILQELDFVATYYVITGRVNRNKYLTVTQLQEMAAGGMEIANHTLSHLGVEKKSAAYITNQVLAAQDQLTAWLGVAPVTFAYPFGYHPKNLQQAVANANLRLAFTTVFGRVHTLKTALLSPRLGIRPSITEKKLLALLTSS